MVENELTNELLLNVPLRGMKKSSISRSADTAIEIIRDFVSRNTKVDKSKIWIDNRVNELVWSKGRYNTQSKLTVKVLKLQDGSAEVILP
ncbi:MAG: 50S ribosomal protein L31e [Candidatus Thermoplasmatota archaeon]|nr:50S ribosomal protein L31e [Candidatus Thermoplasmatota archaeon]MCL6091229.1 50S ribosomal protein L31e [Candidatus Thermoplasmatota archaeon]MDA8142954.1 50S ribosomal protein L31e [Thermoplasmatales archaeon]